MEDMDEYIWQRRIHHGVRYQKGAVPFPESVAAGLEFNAALERNELLDLRLLTNGVVMELCDFARTVNKSETYFLFELLEFNFELGVDADDEQQCYDYGNRAHNKVKMLREQIKLKPRRWKEPFLFPDLPGVTGSAGARRPGRYYPKRNKLVDSSVLSGGRRSAERPRAESPGSLVVVRKRGGVRAKLSADAFPFCRELGVSLLVRPGDARRHRLTPDRATNGAILELLDFSRALCGTHTGIVVDLILHNFGHQMDKTLFRLKLCKATERKNTLLTAEDRDAFRKEPFQVQTQRRYQKRKRRSEADDREPEGLAVAGKRRATPRLVYEDAEDVQVAGELSYMCPVEFEADAPSDLEAGPEEVTVVKEEEEEVFVSPRTAALGPQSPPIGPQNGVSDLFSEGGQEVVVTTQSGKLWRRRAARCKQILTSGRAKDSFARCRERGLDFNAAAAGRRRLHRNLLTNGVLWEVCEFATAMTKSLHSFLFEILDHNFNLLLQDELHQRNFILYLIAKEKVLRFHPDRQEQEFLRSLFDFPEVYNMVDVTGDFQTGQEVETDSDPPVSSASRDPHPFCQEIGLDLWSAQERPASQKLDLAVVTAGAVLEVFSFVRRLCGGVRRTVSDVLQHNFHVDLQSGATLRRWFNTQRSVMEGRAASPEKIDRWLNAVVPLDGLSPLDPRPPAAGGAEEKVLGSGVCRRIGLDLDVGSRREAKLKLDLRSLTRGVLLEMHRHVEQNCNRYVPALYEILDHNFDLSAHKDRKVEFAWAVAALVVAIAAKSGRTGGYLDRSVVLPGEPDGSSRGCKDEPEDDDGEAELHHDDGEAELHGDDGEAELHGDDGEAELHHDDGEAELHGDDGEAELHGDDGEAELHHDDGEAELHGDDGEAELHHDDGEAELHGDDGEAELHHDDGEAELHHDDGEAELHHDDGEAEFDDGEAEFDDGEAELHDDDVEFVRELKPVDIEVEID